MSANQGGNWWSYTEDGTVGIWEITDWERLFEEEIADAEKHYSTTVKRDDIQSTILKFDTITNLGTEMQRHIREDWSNVADPGDIERSAYVAGGITGMAIKANVDASEATLETFESLEDALEWARET